MGSPAKLLNGADVDDPVVEMVHELGHVFVQELLVGVHRVTWEREEEGGVPYVNMQCLTANRKGACMCRSVQHSPARGHWPGCVCCLMKERNSYSACWRLILLSFTD